MRGQQRGDISGKEVSAISALIIIATGAASG